MSPRSTKRGGGSLTRAFAGWLVITTLGCSRSPSHQSSGAPSVAALPLSPSAKSPLPPSPEKLAQLEVSAYTAALAADADTLFVLTERAVVAFAPGRPPERWDLELGPQPALAARGFVHWLDGELRLAPLRGAAPEVLARLPRMPKMLSAAGDHVAWLEAEPGLATLSSLYGSEPRVVYRSDGELEALAVVDDQAYFVEQRSGQWRLGAVPLSGGAARFSALHTSRTPALLAAAGDVFYYDGPSSSLRRLPPDLRSEETIARDVICSPLSVSDRIYCAQISLLFEVPKQGGRAQQLLPKRPGTIAALVATPKRVAWLLDVGENRTDVEVISR